MTKEEKIKIVTEYKNKAEKYFAIEFLCMLSMILGMMWIAILGSGWIGISVTAAWVIIFAILGIRTSDKRIRTHQEYLKRKSEW